jgi:hypothetical protein
MTDEKKTNKKTKASKKAEDANITISIQEKEAGKKRGRKPKGGKITIKPPEKVISTSPIANIILHLKCSLQEVNDHNNIINKMVTDPLVYNPSLPPHILAYNNNSTNHSLYNSNESENTDVKPSIDIAYNDQSDNTMKNCNNICKVCAESLKEEKDEDADINIKDINMKLKRLKIKLYKNMNNDKKAACFWCTYEFDNPSCYIPKYEIDGELFGYGSFCRPECAVAYLMKENIDDSTKFERYQLLNQIYSKVYDYKKNIKPSPNPYYLLDKFFGNLSIQEYRKLLKTEHMLLVIDKPLTRILPELHEDNDDFILNIYGNSQSNQTQTSGVYKVKRESEKQKEQSKSSILKEHFGV